MIASGVASAAPSVSRPKASRRPPAEGRRVGAKLVAAERDGERLALDHLVAGEIGERDRNVGGDSLRKLAAVEVVGALGRDLLQGVGQLRHGEPLALDERAARPVERVALGRIPQQWVEDAVQKRLDLVENHTLARELRRGSKQLRPRH